MFIKSLKQKKIVKIYPSENHANFLKFSEGYNFIPSPLFSHPPLNLILFLPLHSSFYFLMTHDIPIHTHKDFTFCAKITQVIHPSKQRIIQDGKLRGKSLYERGN